MLAALPGDSRPHGVASARRGGRFVVDSVLATFWRLDPDGGDGSDSMTPTVTAAGGTATSEPSGERNFVAIGDFGLGNGYENGNSGRDDDSSGGDNDTDFASYSGMQKNCPDRSVATGRPRRPAGRRAQQAAPLPPLAPANCSGSS